jgi:hypothetical protein
MCNISGVEFEACHAKAVQGNFDGFMVPVISLEDLLKNKQASGSLKDLEDVNALPRRNPHSKRKKKK